MTQALSMRWLAVVLAGLCVMALAPGATGHAGASPGAARHDLPAAGPAGPAPLAQSGNLTGVACVSAADCVAVGAAGAQSFSIFAPPLPLAEHWNGVSWAPLGTPVAPLAAVACLRARLCQAVGGGSAERWNGRAWIAEKTPSVRGAGLSGVSCPAASACVAVGPKWYGQGGRNSVALAETWNGSAWALHYPVNPAGTQMASLSGVSCTGRSACIAVGNYQSATGQVTLAESWNGRAWTVQAMPAAGSPAYLTSVSCASSASCVAVGHDVSGPLAESWNGTTWTVMPAPPTIATSVSCTAATNCMVIGGFTGQSAMSWNGSRWTALGLPPAGLATLNAVSCPAAKSCVAVGGGGGGGSVAMSWDGSAWRGVRVNRADVLSAVSCTRAARCMATGNFETASGKVVVLTESWNGSSWRRRPASQAEGSELSDVSCVSAARCMAVGAIGDSATLAEEWNGTAWRATSGAGIPGQVPTGLSDVSCRGATCLALGNPFDDAWLWNGATWHAIQNVGAGDVSCARPAYCMAVGGHLISPDGPTVAAAELWKGTNWQQLNPPGDSALNTVSCISTTFCVAAGFNFADIWNGASWRLLKLPGPFGIGGPGTFYGGTGISGVSCVDRFACMAVGTYLTKANSLYEGVNVAEFWNGTRWRRLPTAGPGGGLADVSCTSASRCMAVGLRPAWPAGTRLLAEQWNGRRWRLEAIPNP